MGIGRKIKMVCFSYEIEINNKMVEGLIYVDEDEDIISKINNMVGLGYKLNRLWMCKECLGCKFEYGNQEGHMDCPSGCLHDTNSCIVCSNK